MTGDNKVPNHYFELGHALFKRAPELMLVEVWWRADKMSRRIEDQHNFISGYQTARRQNDEYRREQNEKQTRDSATSSPDSH
jgi:hypothetical protein